MKCNLIFPALFLTSKFILISNYFTRSERRNETVMTIWSLVMDKKEGFKFYGLWWTKQVGGSYQ